MFLKMFVENKSENGQVKLYFSELNSKVKAFTNSYLGNYEVYYFEKKFDNENNV